MAEIYRVQQQNSAETNPVLTGVSVGLNVLDTSLKLAEVAIDEFSGNYEEHTDDSHPVYVPYEQENHRAEYDQWLDKQQETETQQLVTVRSELASFMPSQPESAILTQSENIPASMPLAPASITE